MIPNFVAALGTCPRRLVTGSIYVLFLLCGPSFVLGQEMPGMQHEQSAPQYPRLGRAQENRSAPLFTLEQAMAAARESNPTLRQAETEIRAAQARKWQSSLYPNPTVGYIGDEIRGGSVGGGKQGFFLQQTIVTGGKLSKTRAVVSNEIRIAETEAQEQKLRVENSVKAAYYRVLGAQELLDTHRQLASIDQEFALTQRQLFNTGQADESELLQAEIAAERQRLAARMFEITLREQWHSLAALIGRPDLPMTVVSGTLDQNLPAIDQDQIAQTIAAQSPASRIAAASLSRAEAALVLARSAAIPDIQLRGGLLYNNELLDSTSFATGWEGLSEVSVAIPIFNRNQGNVAAAAAELDRAKLEQQRIALTLQQRSSSVLDEYSNAQLSAATYRDEILPRARKAYALLLDKYRQMLASYPRVLECQRALFQLHIEYVSALERVWTTGIVLQGFLLLDGLEAPTRPGEVDQTIRELNLPSESISSPPSRSAP